LPTFVLFLVDTDKFAVEPSKAAASVLSELRALTDAEARARRTSKTNRIPHPACGRLVPRLSFANRTIRIPSAGTGGGGRRDKSYEDVPVLNRMTSATCVHFVVK